MNAVHIFGRDFQVMRELFGGWLLVCDEHGPAIASVGGETGTWLAILECDSDSEAGIGIPEQARREAVTAFREIAWPMISERVRKTADTKPAEKTGE